MRNILIDHQPPAERLVRNMLIAAIATLTLGWWLFRHLKARFYEHL